MIKKQPSGCINRLAHRDRSLWLGYRHLCCEVVQNHEREQPVNTVATSARFVRKRGMALFAAVRHGCIGARGDYEALPAKRVTQQTPPLYSTPPLVRLPSVTSEQVREVLSAPTKVRAEFVRSLASGSSVARPLSSALLPEDLSLQPRSYYVTVSKGGPQGGAIMPRSKQKRWLTSSKQACRCDAWPHDSSAPKPMPRS